LTVLLMELGLCKTNLWSEAKTRLLTNLELLSRMCEFSLSHFDTEEGYLWTRIL
jgi:hypothetical protein